MDIDAFLADSAEAVQGKIYALGIGWNTIFGGAFPVTHRRIAVAMTIHVPYTATNQMHTVSLHLETADGVKVPIGVKPPEAPGGDPEVVLEMGGQFNVGRPPMLPAGDEQIVPLAMTVDGLTFDAPGMYSWVVSIDGKPEKHLAMRVQQRT